MTSREKRIHKCKLDNHEALMKGLVGNKLRIWMSWRDLMDSGFSGTVSVRQKYRSSSNSSRYLIPVAKAIAERNESVFYNESAPDQYLLIQGDVMTTEKGLTVFYSDLKKPMKMALAESGKHITGLQALHLLRINMTPSSFDDLMDLIDIYEDHIIEFSAYSKDLGDCKGRNTIIWEVRKY